MTVNDELLVFISIGDVPMISHCISRGANINYRFNYDSWMIRVLSHCKLHVLQFLFNNGADPILKDYLDNDFADYYLMMMQNKQLGQLGQKEAYFNEIDRWLNEYSTQKFLIEKWPSFYFSLKKMKCMNDNIKDEFNYLNSINYFNLI